MTLDDLIEDYPDEIKKTKWSSHFRKSEDFAELYPNLSPDECFTLSERVSDTYPGTWQRAQVIDYYEQLNGSRQHD